MENEYKSFKESILHHSYISESSCESVKYKLLLILLILPIKNLLTGLILCAVVMWIFTFFGLIFIAENPSHWYTYFIITLDSILLFIYVREIVLNK